MSTNGAEELDEIEECSSPESRPTASKDRYMKTTSRRFDRLSGVAKCVIQVLILLGMTPMQKRIMDARLTFQKMNLSERIQLFPR